MGTGVYRRRFDYRRQRRRQIKWTFAPPSNINGALAVTLGGLGITATGVVVSGANGALDVTLESVGIAATGTVPCSGTAAITLGGLGISASGVVLSGIVGTATITLANVQITATGIVTGSPPSTIAYMTLTASFTQPGITCTFTPPSGG